MPSYSTKSKRNIESCHQDWQTILHYVIQTYDNTVVYGLRTAEQQFELFKKGRRRIDDWWEIVDKSKVVTYKDGYAKLSNHQSGLAVDVIPYPGGWQADEKEFFRMAGVIKSTAFLLKKYGDIQHEVEWGFDLWGWDMAHFQLKV